MPAGHKFSSIYFGLDSFPELEKTMGMAEYTPECLSGNHEFCKHCDCDCHSGPVVTDDDRVIPDAVQTKAERERFLIHALLVAGKTATFGATKTELLLEGCDNRTPFEYLKFVKSEGRIRSLIEHAKTGNYAKMEGAFNDIVNSQIDLEHCTYADLRKIHGIGPKTARYFLMYTRPDINDETSVVLDRHTLRWLRDNGYKAPESSPQDEDEYSFWAVAFAREARKHKMTVREADTFAWNKYSKNEDKGRARAIKMVKVEKPLRTAKQIAAEKARDKGCCEDEAFGYDGRLIDTQTLSEKRDRGDDALAALTAKMKAETVKMRDETRKALNKTFRTKK